MLYFFSMTLDEKHLEHLAGLIRIDLTADEKQSLLSDLKKILDHFAELNEVNTDSVLPMGGGTSQRNVFREDEPETDALGADGLVEMFREREGGYLKIPPVFE
ncbi:MAG: Asp-tRNA(Asn)/Glu-tRNA(Gln) amidotransferase subunit GatC [Candidatus Harrisonbacteria bacterium CG10_big_fil_rev_8_21_14_0_10_40_38]|uniref:Aspartyl/glutamyl-tRNA(Asn/Gln) amidotransferase subunit C n=1 Tax=Candidatus Harrisonbacteria bacterium CG10_big_fil_rev_8_21_14_0_10_40_38 TaxID=1974583 RepID=A0A2H0UT50_9BACT|nr:MAG: Asp-tRNA(Asn)/Glu-tRNA(Gln) amidotransferase subunit GatC [Candidatus Harrisonbacteria bacterium CG10_big_fil_rev_8_21_14_0_10_40_38]